MGHVKRGILLVCLLILASAAPPAAAIDEGKVPDWNRVLASFWSQVTSIFEEANGVMVPIGADLESVHDYAGGVLVPIGEPKPEESTECEACATGAPQPTPTDEPGDIQ